MKNMSVIFVCLLLLTWGIQAQLNKACVVQLKNGSIVKGKITNIIPQESITIVTPQNHQFVIYIDNIAKVRKLKGGIVNWDLSRIDIQFNPVGFVQLGPTLQFDIGIKHDTFIGTHVRFSKIGSWYEGVSEKLPYHMPPSEIAAGISITHFFERIASPNKYYFSLIAEYSQGKSKGPDMFSTERQRENAEISVLAAIGHRWRFSPGLFINLGVLSGISRGIKDNWWYISEPEKVFKGKSKIFFPAMILVAVGWEISKK